MVLCLNHLHLLSHALPGKLYSSFHIFATAVTSRAWQVTDINVFSVYISQHPTTEAL